MTKLRLDALFMKKLLILIAIMCGPAWGQGVFNLYGPVAGVQYNPGGTFQDTAATAAQIANPFSCTSTQTLLGAGGCGTPTSGTVTSVAITFPSPFTAIGCSSTTIFSCAVTWTGLASVAQGGTGAGTLTGYVFGNGTSAFTASTTIPYSALTGTPSIPTGANPSATVGPTVNNGSSNNFMRADAAPAVCLTCNFTWTGINLFSGSPIGATGTTGMSLGGAFGSPLLYWINSSAGTDAKVWREYSNTTTLNFSALNDAESSEDFFLQVVRSGKSITGMTLGNATDLPAIALDGPVTIPAPTSGVALSVTGIGGQPVATFFSPTSQGAVVSFSSNGGTQLWDSGGALSTTHYQIYDVTGGVLDFDLAPGTGAPLMPGIPSSSTAQTGTVCWLTGGSLTYDPSLGCLTSSARFKDHIANLDTGLSQVLALRPVRYQPRPEFNAANLGEQVGLIAEEVQKVDPRLIGLDDKGQPLGVRYAQLTALLVKGEQDLERQILQLRFICGFLALWCAWLTWGRRHDRK